MHELITFLQQGISAGTLGELAYNWRVILFSTDPLVWLFVIGVLRYNVGAWVLWLTYVFNRRALFPTVPNDGYLPMVSVIIAGRNPGQSIERTIRSCLDSGYPNVEVLYSDDFSVDGSAVYARPYEVTGRVRVFASEQHSGKPTNLNIALMMARGELAFVVDADSELEFGTITRLVQYFRDPHVGAVSAEIYVRNATDNLLTRLQEIEYALNFTTARIWRAKLGMLPILPGAAAMFRMRAIRGGLGGYDTGLGDDTDMTIRMIKLGWDLKYAAGARVWTDCPSTLPTLLRQRIRWARNMVKVRIGKHRDLATFRYGVRPALAFWDIILFRFILPIWATYTIIMGLALHFGDRTFLLTNFYAIATVLVLFRVLIANDVSGQPPLFDTLLMPLYLPYRFMLRTADVYAMIRELLRIKKYHPYVPKRIWAQIPHW